MARCAVEALTLESVMSFNLTIKLLILYLSTFAFVTNAQSIYQQPMLRLNADNNSASQVQTLKNYQGAPLLTAFFMPNCPWCQRQHKILKRIQHQCPEIQTVMLGVQGSKQNLRHELKREKNTFPAFLANNNIIQAVGADSPVPMMLLFNSEGTLIFKTVGYTKQDELTKLITKSNIKLCQS
jgi:thioredoxin-related protein